MLNALVDESLREICHYQQNVPQHYLLGTLVNSGRSLIFNNYTSKTVKILY